MVGKKVPWFKIFFPDFGWKHPVFPWFPWLEKVFKIFPDFPDRWEPWIWTDLHFCVEKQFSLSHFYPDNKFLLPSSSHWKDLYSFQHMPIFTSLLPQHPRQLACHCHANVRNLQLMLNIIRSDHILNFCLIYSCNFHFKKQVVAPPSKSQMTGNVN